MPPLLPSSTRRWHPGRDRHAVRHLPQPPRAGADPHRPRSVVVVGGGIAGLAASSVLAEQGVHVTLVEREDTLGGRVRSWPLGDGRTMSRGFHAFFRQYYNLRALLRRTDPAQRHLVAVPDYPLQLAGGHRDSFARIPRTPPFGMAAFVARSPSFTARDLAEVDVRRALDLLEVDFPATFRELDGTSASEVLDRLRFPAKARHLALEVFARSFFAHPDEFSGAELVAMFHSYFLGSAEGLLFDVPDDDYDQVLWAPLGRYLTSLGAEVRTGTAVTSLAEDGDGVLVGVDGAELRADAVVLATDQRPLQQLVAGAPWIGDEPWRERVASLRSAPSFAVWRMWLDRPCAPGTLPFLGTSGFPGGLDNVTMVHTFEETARRWAARTGGSVVELHAYAVGLPTGVDPHAERSRTSAPDEVTLRRELRASLSTLHPELDGAQVLAEEWLLRDDCALVGTGPWDERLEVETPDPRVVLAGDGLRCDLPVALMERATTTGFQAANALLARWGRTGEDVWSVPVRGLLA
ncbi:NAD(P)/FAD-dependent oxidoreductase [Auraticoccus monumenti]|uniref:Isorenieratene synthase n=1 Tax=Auraticoccus monumenti TaxID=675864 RepID=A0A1G6VLL2_9ACTN|nr:NAD(P)/FAD-dependent oxidoreductase [Auraticoccus monumenti]SDD54411.1 isorenieratene synthase [Auraticoccus monumenti]